MSLSSPASSPALTIVHVVFSSRIAGGERHCIDLAQAQAALGHRVHVIGSRGSAVAGELGPGIQFHGLALPLLRACRVRRLARRLGADVCHGHLGPACKAVAAVRGAARVATLHVGYKAHHHARQDGLICVNRTQAQQLPAFDGAVSVIHNWAPERAPAPLSLCLRRELGLRPDQPLVGSVGRLHPSKGMDLLIQAFRDHAPADAALAILGEGKDLEALQRLRGGDARIHLLGYRADVEQALQSMDLFVSPSREEAFPLAILEAMRVGLPILATATQGPSEMLAQQPATLVPVNDVAALGRALRERIEALRAQPGQAVDRQRVEYCLQAYQRPQAVARVLAFYRDVLSRRAKAPRMQPRLQSGAAHV
ncbi:glycosyltransferase [Kinneretia aquatilis]|uniref:glycosyltransferase n=1 Tax=Kinneretia aquatilis TaxID=2070761 RepID=UPI0014952558|nr:glycosyltransferase [Paucibacter aquatile]WIV98368.1 glycosyltransferase [Paucibacter aquatile]